MNAKQLRLGFMGFVDAAIMGPVPIEGIQVLTLASGSRAARFKELLAPYGMNIQVIEGKAGAASAMKLIRSVFMKGLAALLIETLEAAQRQGIRDAVATDIAGWGCPRAAAGASRIRSCRSWNPSWSGRIVAESSGASGPGAKNMTERRGVRWETRPYGE